MDETPINLKLTVAEVLAQHPETASVFIRHKTACIGCHLDRFCALQEAISAYSLDEPGFVAELQEVSAKRTSTHPRSTA